MGKESAELVSGKENMAIRAAVGEETEPRAARSVDGRALRSAAVMTGAAGGVELGVEKRVRLVVGVTGGARARLGAGAERD
jgi:hypothetical protein